MSLTDCITIASVRCSVSIDPICNWTRCLSFSVICDEEWNTKWLVIEIEWNVLLSFSFQCFSSSFLLLFPPILLLLLPFFLFCCCLLTLIVFVLFISPWGDPTWLTGYAVKIQELANLFCSYSQKAYRSVLKKCVWRICCAYILGWTEYITSSLQNFCENWFWQCFRRRNKKNFSFLSNRFVSSLIMCTRYIPWLIRWERPVCFYYSFWK